MQRTNKQLSEGFKKACILFKREKVILDSELSKNTIRVIIINPIPPPQRQERILKLANRYLDKKGL